MSSKSGQGPAKHKGAKTGVLLELWVIRGWIWENDSQPWTHWATTRINTRIHQASNHISWGWEPLYSRPLNALCTALNLPLVYFYRFSVLWPISSFLSIIKLHNSKPNEKDKMKTVYLNNHCHLCLLNSQVKKKHNSHLQWYILVGQMICIWQPNRFPKTFNQSVSVDPEKLRVMDWQPDEQELRTEMQ